MKGKPSNRAKCDYCLARADAERLGPCDPRYAADGQAALFVDTPTARALPLFAAPVAALNETQMTQPDG